MNILYICHYAGSMEMGMAFRPYYLAREWEKNGHKVRIIGASFSHLRLKNPIVHKDFELQQIDGVEYQWIKTISYDHNGVARAWTMAQFCGKLWWHAKEIACEFKPDVVITSSTYPMDTWSAQRIVKYSGAKLIHENHDLWPLTLTTIGHMSEYHPFVLLCGVALKSAIKHSVEIVSLWPYAYEYFEQFGLDDLRKFHYIPNGIALQDWENPAPLPEEHQKLFDSLEGKFIVLYAGGHALSNDLGIFIDTARKVLGEKDIVFVLVGNGVEKEKLISKAKKQYCDNVFFLPGVTEKSVPSVLGKADLLYVGGKIDAWVKYGTSLNKLYDYMMAGRPIILASNIRNKEILEAKAGSEVLTSEVGEIVEKVLEYYHKSSFSRSEIGLNGQRWVIENREFSVLAHAFELLFPK